MTKYRAQFESPKKNRHVSYLQDNLSADTFSVSLTLYSISDKSLERVNQAKMLSLLSKNNCIGKNTPGGGGGVLPLYGAI